MARLGKTVPVLFVPVCAFIAGFIVANVVIHPKCLLLNNAKSEQQQRNAPLSLQTSEIRHQTDDSPSDTDLRTGPKKYFLDCGGNMASSVLMFREIYPDAHEYIIHSFEIDEKLSPYFAPYLYDGKTFPHIPMGVAGETGTLTAYLEGPWYPGKINNRKDMQWGGGSLFAFPDEKKNTEELGGGRRKLSRHVEVPIVDLSEWIRNNTRKEDYVILKLDVEGAEYDILTKMLEDKTFDWVDKFYGEFHGWSPTGKTKEERDKIARDLKASGIKQLNWAGESKTIADFDSITSIKVAADTPGSLDSILDNCKNDDKHNVALIIEVGMNAKLARRLIGTISAYSEQVPLTLFVYGDFAQQNPDLVKEWSQRYDIEIRIGSNWPSGNYWQLQNKNLIRMDIVSAMVKFHELDLHPGYIFPSDVNGDVHGVIKSKNLRTINSTMTFPPKTGDKLNKESYFKFRDVERIPKALNMIHSALGDTGGILSLDSDFPDNHMISVFLLDYLYEVSPHHIVSLRQCLK